MTEIMHGFGDNGELSRGARLGLEAWWQARGGPFHRIALTNLLPTGDFQGWNEGWNYYGSSAVFTDGTVKATGTGTLGGVGIYSAPGYRYVGQGGHIYYGRVRMRVTASGANGLQMTLNDGTRHETITVVESPVANQWYEMSSTFVMPGDFDGKEIQTYVRGNWPSAATASGKVTEIETVFVADLTEAYGPGSEPPAAVIDELMARFSRSYFNGTEEDFDRVYPAAADRERFMPMRRHSVTQGPHVVLRFDDGYENNLKVAAPIMAMYGMCGTLFTGTDPVNWLGTMQPAGRIMTAEQLVELHTRYGWEIGSHTRQHHDAIATDLAVWVSSVTASVEDIVAMGLPYPRSFAYPNGSRTASTDRFVYRLFEKCALTGGPERLPTDYLQPAFFTGWTTVPGSGATKANMIERLKAYVRESFAQGRSPVLGFHGVDYGEPPVTFSLDSATFTTIIRWLAEEGYPVGTMQDLPTHNLIADPGFEMYPVRTWADGSHPWGVLQNDGWQRETPASTGIHQMRLNGTFTNAQVKTLEQRFAVKPETVYNLWAQVRIPTYTSGEVRFSAYYYDALGEALGQTFDIIRVNAANGSDTQMGGRFTTPPGAVIAKIGVASHSSTGFSGDCRIGHVAVSDASLYDPLAITQNYPPAASGGGGATLLASPMLLTRASTVGVAGQRLGRWPLMVPSGIDPYVTRLLSPDGSGNVVSIPADISPLGYAINVTTAGAAGAFVRLAIYDGNSGNAGALLWQSGDIDATTTGVKEIASGLTLPAGTYWVFGASNDGTVRVYGWRNLPDLQTNNPFGANIRGAQFGGYDVIANGWPTDASTVFIRGHISSAAGAPTIALNVEALS